MRFCDCTQDGYCPRYQRDMTGRFREICAGTNCDLGTAAVFREQWAQEASSPSRAQGEPTAILLRTDQAPGDAVVATAAIYSLHKAHPGKYLTAVESIHQPVFDHNPHLIPAPELPYGHYTLQMHYPAIHQSNQRGIHFMQGFCEHLGKSLGVEVPLLTNRPHLYFDEPERPTEGFWIICSGGKNDLTNKLWGTANFQSVVDQLRSRIIFVQVGGNERDHPLLNGSTHRVAQTDLRQLFQLVRRARGVLCGVSLLMHVAAALEKPCVVIAGGREPVQWNAYPKQHYLHTVGALPCSSPQGDVGVACWRSRVLPQGDDPVLDQDPCLRPVQKFNGLYPLGTFPECMTLIDPRMVADLIMTIDKQLTKV